MNNNALSKSEFENQSKNLCTCDNGLCRYHCGYANGYTMSLVKRKHTSSHRALYEAIQSLYKKIMPKDNDISSAYDAGYKEGWEKGIRNTENLVKNLSTYKYTFSLADSEFGETYHIAGALSLSSPSIINISCTHEKQMLFLLTILENGQIFFEQGLRDYYLKLKRHEKTSYKINTTQRFEQATRIIEELRQQKITAMKLT